MNTFEFKVVEIKRLKYKDKNKIYQTLSTDPFPNSPLTPSLASNIIIHKYLLGVPLYRYSGYLVQNVLNISPQNLSNYVSRSMDLLEEFYNQLENRLVSTEFKVIHADETEIQVIDTKKSKCYMFVYTTSFWDNPVYIYKFSENRKTDNTKELLKNYKGYLEYDGYAGYNAISSESDNKIKIQRCWTYARRYFYDCFKGLPDKEQKNSPAYKVVELINKMFYEESILHKENKSKSEIEKYRNSEEYKNIIDGIDKAVNEIDYANNSYLKKHARIILIVKMNYTHS